MLSVVHLLVLIAIFTILAIGLNVAVGYTGILNFGYISFFGIGAYTSALVAMKGFNYPVVLLAAGVAAAVVGIIVGYIIHRFKGDYVALVTLGFNFILVSLMLNWKSLTRGPLGIPGIPAPHLGAWRANTRVELLMLAALVVVILFWFVYRLMSSRYGKLLEAVRDDAIGLEMIGKNVRRLKIESMALSTFCAGIAGSLFAHYITYIEPSMFFVIEVVAVFTIIIVGGLASLSGTLIAAVIIILVPELLRFVHLPSSVVGPARQILYAVALLGIIMLRPRGIRGRVDLE